MLQPTALRADSDQSAITKQVMAEYRLCEHSLVVEISHEADL